MGKNLIEVEINKNLISEKSLIFISKHVSKKGIPAVTSHFIGNVKEAELGGKRKEFGHTEEEAIESLFEAIHQITDLYKKDAKDNYARTGQYILGSSSLKYDL